MPIIHAQRRNPHHSQFNTVDAAKIKSTPVGFNSLPTKMDFIHDTFSHMGFYKAISLKFMLIKSLRVYSFNLSVRGCSENHTRWSSSMREYKDVRFFRLPWENNKFPPHTFYQLDFPTFSHKFSAQGDKKKFFSVCQNIILIISIVYSSYKSKI